MIFSIARLIWGTLLVYTHYIFNIKENKPPHNIGNKAKKLRFLIEKKLQIPPTYVCTWDAYTRYLKNDQQIRENIRYELSRRINVGRSYAIRSSANIEDRDDHSFAGQFKSLLNVWGIDNIMHAVETIWLSTHSSSVKAYLEKIGIDQSNLRMATTPQEFSLVI